MSDLQVQGQAPSIPQGASAPQAPQNPQGFNQGVPQYQAPQAPVVPQQPYVPPVQPNQPYSNVPPQGSPYAQPTINPLGSQVPQAPQEPFGQAPVSSTPSYDSDNPLDVSVQYFAQGAGISAEQFYDAIVPAMQYGDPNLINLSHLTQNLKPEQKAHAEALAKAAYQQAQQVKQQTVATAHQKAGGAENWQQAVGAFNAQATPEQKGYAKYLEEQGKINEAVDYVLGASRQFGFINTTQGSPVQGNLSGQAVRGLSKADYHSELAKLAKEVGYSNMHTDPRFTQLSNARTLGTQQGL